MKNTSELFCEFKYFEMIPYEQGITRRDPSPVIFAKGLYYVWYSKTNKSYSGYPADIWYATSKDGYNWQEAGPALLKGELDEFDGYGVFTPSIIVANEKYYLITIILLILLAGFIEMMGIASIMPLISVFFQ